MVTINKIRKRYGGNICHQCINESYKTNLLHTDCKYGLMYPSKCAKCGEMKNIT